MLDRLPFFLLFYPLLLFSLSCHEAAHGWMAERYGDGTARHMGRISLNPLRHIDPIGTFLLPVIAIFSGAPLIGWGKPVPVNPMHLKNAIKDTVWISAFGPITNFILASLFALIGWGMVIASPGVETVMYQSYHLFMTKGSPIMTWQGILGVIVVMGVFLNLVLAFFNLIPIYPLDGGGVLRGLLPARLVPKFDAIGRYSIFILIILLVTGGLKIVLMPALYLANWMLPH